MGKADFSNGELVEEKAGQARTKDAGREPELGLLSHLNFTGIFPPDLLH